MNKLGEILEIYRKDIISASASYRYEEISEIIKRDTKSVILNLLKEIIGQKKTPKQRANGVSEVLTAEDKIRNDFIEEINERIDKYRK